ncbi:hypothetical protein [Tautonia marina]|uniref:hypothetical protein n=1 Tax=Tautonia marina TaxID=2653855 RepID=UPI0013759167|nr:hypothetical protein [Tautonia marina]
MSGRIIASVTGSLNILPDWKTSGDASPDLGPALRLTGREVGAKMPARLGRAGR